MIWIIIGTVVGVVGLGYVYHRWTAQTTSVIDAAAADVNKVIADAKAKTAANTVVANTTPANTAS